jgi:hypothetical protein
MRKFSLLLVILLSFAMLTTVSAGELGLFQVGGKAGVILPEDPWSTGFFLGGTANIGELADNMELFPVLAYWSSGYDLGSFSLDLSNIQIGVDLHYYLENVQGLYVGGGVGLNFLSIDIPSFSFFDESSTTSSTSTEFGIGVLGGYEIPLGDNTGFIEAKYNIISDLNTLEIAFGILFDL